MACSPVQLAKRALVTLLLALARQYAMPALPLSRDSPDKVVMESFKKVAKKVHPDKGGATEDAQKLNEAREAWDNVPKREGAEGGITDRHTSLVPLGRPRARASSRRGNLSRHTGQFGRCQKQMLCKLGGGGTPATRQLCSTP